MNFIVIKIMSAYISH